MFDVEDEQMLNIKLLGKNFPNPIGLASGFDKSAEVYNSLLKLGFGFVDIVETNKINNLRYIKRLGIDALDKNLSEKYLFHKFHKSNVLIKQLLLNQYIVAGIGNIYACEILYDAKISPLRKGSSLKKYQIGTILKSTRKILKKAIKYGGSSISDYVSPDGTLGNFQNNFKVYGRAGKKIKGYEIKKEVLYGRSTFFCPKLQK